MRVGDLNKRVVLQYETRTPDGMGGATVAWTDAAEVWAAVWPVNATQQIEAAGQAMTITHRIRMRYRPDLRGTWRIKFGTRYFSIHGIVNPNERGAMLDVLCTETASA